MLTSKKVREEIFNTSTIMRRIKVQFLIKNDFQGGKLKFLIAKGEFIRNIKLIVNGKSENLTRFILHQVPNLEKFCFIDYYSSYDHFDELVFECGKFELFQEPAKLVKLKTLCFRSCYVRSLIENMAKVDNLENLTFNLQEELTEHENEIFYNFLARQEQLKSWNAGRSLEKLFMSKDIGTKFKFELKSLTFSSDYPKFNNFFKSQAENLEELFINTRCPELFEIIVKNCKKLRKFQSTTNCEYLSHRLPVDWRMETVRKLDARYTYQKLRKIYERFPNLESFKCSKLEDISGIFKNLLSLDLEMIFLDNFQNIKFPNLLKLKVGIIKEHVNENNWKNFLKNSPKIEKIKIKILKTKCEFIPNYIFESLKSCEKIEMFEIWIHSIISDGGYQHKIFVDFKFKTVNPGKYYVKAFKEIFYDFKIVENFKIKKFKYNNRYIDTYECYEIDYCC